MLDAHENGNREPTEELLSEASTSESEREEHDSAMQIARYRRLFNHALQKAAGQVTTFTDEESRECRHSDQASADSLPSMRAEGRNACS